METLVNAFRRRLLPNRRNFDFAQFSVSKFSSSHLDIERRSSLICEVSHSDLPTYLSEELERVQS